ncbi:MAG: hypothetical protein KGP35_05880 [Bacteroidetes bacterium]|nr:hypothetical protein [Bacteroidota bacterium]
MKKLFQVAFFIGLIVSSAFLQAQDSIGSNAKQRVRKDSLVIKQHSPRKAATYSAVLPGLGQAYNKKYWKIPIVYAALGTCVGLFIYNRDEYLGARDAYRNKLDNDPTNDNQIRAQFRPIDPESIRRYRNSVRQDVDYSVLAFVLCWGLNIVDAAVDGHLHSFDINENLSLRINPYVQPATGAGGMQLVLDFSKRKNKLHPTTF